tara:strand:+ start:257 stop:844 length:588 start_codon:yes stop_codon:yes gene_type:complete
MDTKNVEKYLNSFGNQVVNEMNGAKDNLHKAKGNTALGDSIRFQVVPTDTGFSTRFYMLDYGEFLDKGVSGTEKQISFEDYKGRRRSSDYSYTTKQPPTGILELWIKKKGLKGRKSLIKHRKGDDKTKKIKGAGQFITDKSFAFAIAKTIKRKGIKSLSFFQIPLGIGYKKLQENLLTELKLDIETYLTTFYRPK